MTVHNRKISFPLLESPHIATIKDRCRNSGLTSVRFKDHETLLCADFNDKTIYKIRIVDGQAEFLATARTTDGQRNPVQTDLMDVRGNTCLLSNFYQGTFSSYDVTDDIRFLQEHKFADITNLHGIRFIPNTDNWVWLAYCNSNKRCHQVVDLLKNEIVYHFDVDEQCQDIAFLGDYAVVFARTDHITKGKPKSRWFSRPKKMYATAYIYDISNLKTQKPALVSIWTGQGHIDAVKEYKSERIFAANQYDNTVDIFQIKSGKISMLDRLTGYNFPHGLDIHGETLAVTNYGDQTLILRSLHDLQ